ncbi:MAG TPA: FAD-dependent monooxygenase, partial [Nocardioidaceae bacterium]|nr:FAD-dependent monooxygenase [Nocardioidaceae bacterium]
MRIAVIGGGPGGLYFAALAQQLSRTVGARHEITVWERNAADDTFGFGVVFSDETLGGIEHADPAVYRAMAAEFAVWDDIDVHVKGEVVTSGGHGFAAMSRKRLLQILQERCADLGVDVRFSTPAPDVDELARDYDLVVACDGLNSEVRQRYAATFRPTLDVRDCKYMWLGTDRVFDAFKFYISETPHGVMQVHGYPFDTTGSTFIVEMNSAVWEKAGFGEHAHAWQPGESDEESIARIRDLFPDVLDDHAVLANNSRWISFTTVRNEQWRHGNVVLLGDAAHTAHFSIGSGTKLAMEDALSLAACLHEESSLDAALKSYATERKAVVASTQRAAQASLEWFENLGQYVDQEPLQFGFNIMTRSRRVTYDNLRVRDPEFVDRLDAWFADHEQRRGNGTGEVRPPMFQPFTLRSASGAGLELHNRVVVSPMDMYVATDGMPDDFHLVHLGGKALGGAGLVMTEMVCTSPEGRITPGCTGMWTDAQRDAWKRVVDFVHRDTEAKIGLQLGHSGGKGSTKLMWEGIDQPLDSGNWEVAAASPVPYRAGVNQVPRELSRADLDEIRQEFVDAARRGAEAGFDLLELHCAHGYLLSGFLSPCTNRRTDEYGGDVQGRLRFPLEVWHAVREVWPTERPMTVRISATDWVEDGQTLA